MLLVQFLRLHRRPPAPQQAAVEVHAAPSGVELPLAPGLSESGPDGGRQPAEFGQYSPRLLLARQPGRQLGRPRRVRAQVHDALAANLVTKPQLVANAARRQPLLGDEPLAPQPAEVGGRQAMLQPLFKMIHRTPRVGYASMQRLM